MSFYCQKCGQEITTTAHVCNTVLTVNDCSLPRQLPPDIARMVDDSVLCNKVCEDCIWSIEYKNGYHCQITKKIERLIEYIKGKYD